MFTLFTEKKINIIVMNSILIILSLLNLTLTLLSKNSDINGLVSSKSELIVNKNGDGDFVTIQEAIDNSFEGDTITIHKGLYKENLVIDKSIFIRSTYSITKDTMIIDSTIIDGSNQNKVILISTDYNSIKIDGLTIRNGQSINSKGGGIFANNTELIISNSKFRYNKVIGTQVMGGAIYIENGSLFVSDCIFENNSGDSGNGAGIHIQNVNETIIKDSQFLNNEIIGTSNSFGGGAISIFLSNLGKSVEIIDSRFEGNSSTKNGGAIYFRSGANEEDVLKIKGSFFLNNLSGGRGSGISVSKSGGTIDKNQIRISKSKFINNRGGRGSIHSDGSFVMIQNTLFYDNDESNLDILSGRVKLYNSNIINDSNVTTLYLWNGAEVEIKNSILRGTINYSTFYSPNFISIVNSSINSNQVIPSDKLLILLYSDNIESNPLFLDDANLNFNVSQYSLTIGAGQDILGINDDITGNRRPYPEGSLPDIGIFESELGKPRKLPAPDEFRIDLVDSTVNMSWVYNDTLSPLISTFEVEKIVDNLNLTDTLQTDKYSLVDTIKPNKVYYYRLRMVTNDDRYSLFTDSLRISITFMLSENGVTVTCNEASIGETGIINGVEYTKRSKDQITTENASTTCTSGITDMDGMFREKEEFNGDISHWDVSSVTDMGDMFNRAESFNQDISVWNVSNVTSMSGMFIQATSFNQDISEWDVSSVTNMLGMFKYSSFNQPLGDWDVSNVTDMGEMFSFSSFNQEIDTWDVASVSNMASMFNAAKSFNQPIGSWEVDSVSNMDLMFGGASTFNQDLKAWCTPLITSAPESFSTSSGLEESNLPIWGKCFDLFYEVKIDSMLSYGPEITVEIKTENITAEDSIKSFNLILTKPNGVNYKGYTVNGTHAEDGLVEVAETDTSLLVGFASNGYLSGEKPLIQLFFLDQDIVARDVHFEFTDFLYNNLVNYTEDIGLVGIVHNLGDVDNDGKILAYDAANTLQYSVGLDPLPSLDPLPWQYWRIGTADVNFDEVILASDASDILKYSVGLINEFSPPVKGKLAVPQINIYASNRELRIESLGNGLFAMNLEFPIQEGMSFGEPSKLENVLMASNMTDTLFKLAIASSSDLAGNFVSIPITNIKGDEVLDIDYYLNNTFGQVQVDMSGWLTSNDGVQNKPTQFELSQNYPNPFNPSTQIQYALPEATQVTLEVFNSVGQKVMELVNSQKSAGYHAATFDASGLSSGVYLYKITTPSFTETKKMLLIK